MSPKADALTLTLQRRGGREWVEVPAVEAVLEGSAGRKQATLGLSPLVIGSAPE
jgi:hypothetical protein